MVNFPSVKDINEAANNLLGETGRGSIAGASFQAPIPSSAQGNAVRQTKIPAFRDAVPVRNMVRWLVPEVGVVEMFINPQSISYKDSKQITSTRTKGGYVVQYWGEELTQITIEGTTGSSGVEGINVLFDIYRAEQIALDPQALVLAAQLDRENSDVFGFLGGLGSGIGDLFGGDGDGGGPSLVERLASGSRSNQPEVSRARPSLASFAFTIEMYWSGWVYRGYFKDFQVTERADNLGLFNYNISFVATQRRGLRNNFLGWHRSATNGPSDSSPDGVPHSFGNLVGE